MKKKTIFSVSACMIASGLLNAQMVVSDPGQNVQTGVLISQGSEILSTAVKAFKQEQQIYSQAKESYGEFVQMKNYIATAEDRLKTIGDIKELKLNNVNAILDKVLCLKQGNFFPRAVRYLDIIARMKAAFLNCSNQELYGKTYSGVLENYNIRLETAGTAGAHELNARLNDLNSGLFEAEKTKGATNAYNARMKLELGLKYKAISDELMDASEEVHLAINQDKGSDKNIALSPVERMKMMDLANQYQLQAIEYEEKSAKLLKEASEADAEQQRQIQGAKREIANKQIINFNL